MKHLIAILILLMAIPLSGCIPVAVVAGATAGSTIAYDKRSLPTILEDRDSAQTAQNIINGDSLLKNRAHISVAVFNHVALMVGQAQTPQLRERAYLMVKGVKNIQKVYNEVHIEGSISTLDATNDAWLTTKVKSVMLGTKGLRSAQIKVVTENATVYLMGWVARDQADLAANAARRVEGVRKVVRVFQYIN